MIDSRITWFDWLVLAVILIGWPLLQYFGTPAADNFEELVRDNRLLIYLEAFLIEWIVFGFVFVALIRSRSQIASLGFDSPGGRHLLYAILFLVAANLILGTLEMIFSPEDTQRTDVAAALLPETPTEILMWVALALSAGFCEEIAFRGFALVRLRQAIHGNHHTANAWYLWILPVILTSVAFGLGHTYQGVSGALLVVVYGALFALLRITSDSLWPCVIAHAIQDTIVLFLPQNAS